MALVWWGIFEAFHFFIEDILAPPRQFNAFCLTTFVTGKIARLPNLAVSAKTMRKSNQRIWQSLNQLPINPLQNYFNHLKA